MSCATDVPTAFNFESATNMEESQLKEVNVVTSQASEDRVGHSIPTELNTEGGGGQIGLSGDNNTEISRQTEYSKVIDVSSSEMKADTSDALSKGYGVPIDRPDAPMPVSCESREYNMNHKKRGRAIIFFYENFGCGGPGRRTCAEHDADICTKAFKKLGFQVELSKDLREKDFTKRLKEVSKFDHSDSDALIIAFMSHGGIEKNKEFIWTYDKTVDTSDLWKNFTAEKCPSLAGKPKLFFIQACRGEDVDKGITLTRRKRGLRVETDSISEEKINEYYAIPLHADMLMMWASYPGMFAFKSMNGGLSGSVFIHYLAKVLSEEGMSEDLSSLLLTVTRKVAIHYESHVPNNYLLDQNKQLPYTVSTLLRKVHFKHK